MGHSRQESINMAENNDRSSSIPNIVRCLQQAASVFKVNEGAVIKLLDELKNVINQQDLVNAFAEDFKNRSPHLYQPIYSHSPLYSPFLATRTWSNVQISNTDLDPLFLSLAVRHNVIPYVKARVQWGGLIRLPNLNNWEMKWPLLLDALFGDVPEPRMVECLLNLGADPNSRASKGDSQTPWIMALTKVTLLYTVYELDSSEEYITTEGKWRETLRLMFSRGADCTATLESRLTPLSREILEGLRSEAIAEPQSSARKNSWLRHGG